MRHADAEALKIEAVSRWAASTATDLATIELERSPPAHVRGVPVQVPREKLGDAVARDAGAGYVLWEAGQATVANTLGSLASFFVFYDACYHPFHRFLHVRWMYGFVHKHHHQH